MTTADEALAATAAAARYERSAQALADTARAQATSFESGVHAQIDPLAPEGLTAATFAASAGRRLVDDGTHIFGWGTLLPDVRSLAAGGLANAPLRSTLGGLVAPDFGTGDLVPAQGAPFSMATLVGGSHPTAFFIAFTLRMGSIGGGDLISADLLLDDPDDSIGVGLYDTGGDPHIAAWYGTRATGFVVDIKPILDATTYHVELELRDGILRFRLGAVEAVTPVTSSPTVSAQSPRLGFSQPDAVVGHFVTCSAVPSAAQKTRHRAWSNKVLGAAVPWP